MLECNPSKGVVIIGDMGTGKSTFINAVQGSQQKTGNGASSVTQNFNVINKNGLELLDCPGFGDMHMDEEEWSKDYKKAVEQLKTPLSAIGFVCNSTNYRVSAKDCEWSMYMKCLFKNLKSENIVFIFTHVDMHQPDPDQHIGAILEGCGFDKNPDTKDLSVKNTKRIFFNKNDCISTRKDLINVLQGTNTLSLNDKETAAQRFKDANKFATKGVKSQLRKAEARGNGFLIQIAAIICIGLVAVLVAVCSIF